MSNRSDSAIAQLTRLLYLIPAASSPEGLSLSEASRRLGVDEETVLADIRDLSAREFYHPAGGAEDLRVEVESDRIRVRSSGKFGRPRRLSPREALATHLALRSQASGLSGAARDRVLSIADRFASGLAAVPVDDLVDRFSVEESGESAGPALAELRRATAAGVRCEIVYVSADGATPTVRTLDPYGIAVADGHWYAIGHCGVRKDVRVFRIDRIIDLRTTENRFEVPADFRLEEYVREGRVFRSDATVPVVINYSGGTAARLAGHPGAKAGRAGTISIRHEVAEPDWVVRHVLGCGGEAVVESPPELRERVAAAADRLSRSA
ncbi:MAG: WYL domain-containing protein, partial [Gemmatimonadota bacterium]|nr:WYL domain-containing protein [Gemmatimonadota bacterium]